MPGATLNFERLSDNLIREGIIASSAVQIVASPQLGSRAAYAAMKDLRAEPISARTSVAR